MVEAWEHGQLPPVLKWPIKFYSAPDHAVLWDHGVEQRYVIDVRDLQARPEPWACHMCTGDNGFVQALLAFDPKFHELANQIAAIVAPQRFRQGGARVGFVCKYGYGQSVGMANLLARALGDVGWTSMVSANHLSVDYMARLCKCGDPKHEFCPMVRQRLVSGDASRNAPLPNWLRSQEEAKRLHRDQTRALRQAKLLALPFIAEAFARVGLPIR